MECPKGPFLRFVFKPATLERMPPTKALALFHAILWLPLEISYLIIDSTPGV